MAWPFCWKWPFIKAQTGLAAPRLRLYQQIALLLLFIGIVPLGGASFVIYKINQRALKKELTSFTEQLAMALFEDMTTEMSWQERNNQKLGQTWQYLRLQYQPKAAAQTLLKLDTDLIGVGLIPKPGENLQRLAGNINTNKGGLPSLPTETSQLVHYQVFQQGGAKPTYYLISQVPINSKTGWQQLVLVRRFDYLAHLIARNQQALHDAVFVVDESGQVVAGPAWAQNHRLTTKDLALFKGLKPGVASVLEANIGQELATKATPVPSLATVNDDEEKLLQTVFVKIPKLGWGLILESPYHVRQTYIKTAGAQAFLLIAASLGIIAFISVAYLLGIIRNFRQVIKGIKAVAQGNYGRRVRLITNAVTPHELVYLTGEFNRMAKKISDQWETIEAANRQLAQLDELKSNLIDTVSHELRTPLTNIKGYTSRLLRYGDNLEAETRQKSLTVIKQQADRLSRLVEDLLVIPDLEGHRLKLALDTVSLGEVLETCTQALGHRLEPALQIKTWPGQLNLNEVLLWTDADRLEQVLLNLLENAVKYRLPESLIELVVDLTEENNSASPQPQQVQLIISNPVEPMDEALLPHLFEKFSRLDESTTRTTRGSGLGLYITKALAEALGGSLTLKLDKPQPTNTPKETQVFMATLCLPLSVPVSLLGK